MIYAMNILMRKIILKLHSKVLRRREMVIRFSKSQMVFPLFCRGVGWWLAIYRDREPDQLYILSKILSEGNRVLDIGANIGYYTLMEAELMNGKGTIFACEPDDRNLEYLKRNISINGLDNIVEVFSCAISNKSGSREFHICEESNLNALDKTNWPATRMYIGIKQVKVVSLSEFLKRIGANIDLMRMDIEGHEIQIFSSLVDFIKNKDGLGAAPNNIVFETHPWEYENKQASVKLFREIFSLGYNVRYIVTKREDNSPLHEHGYKPIKTIKWRCIKKNFYGIYQDVDPVLSANLICNHDKIRTVCLHKKTVT